MSAQLPCPFLPAAAGRLKQIPRGAQSIAARLHQRLRQDIALLPQRPGAPSQWSLTRGAVRPESISVSVPSMARRKPCSAI